MNKSASIDDSIYSFEMNELRFEHLLKNLRSALDADKPHLRRIDLAVKELIDQAVHERNPEIIQTGLDLVRQKHLAGLEEFERSLSFALNLFLTKTKRLEDLEKNIAFYWEALARTVRMYPPDGGGHGARWRGKIEKCNTQRDELISDNLRFAKAPRTINCIVSEQSKIPEGSVIQLLDPAWTMIAKLIIENANELPQLGPRKWEKIIAGAYDKAGYDEVILTPRSGDAGRDIIATKHGLVKIRIIDEVKAYKQGNKVTAKEVRALLGVLQADRNATKGLVTTTSSFAPGVQEDEFIKPFLPYRLELVDGPHLIERLRRLLNPSNS